MRTGDLAGAFGLQRADFRRRVGPQAIQGRLVGGQACAGVVALPFKGGDSVTLPGQAGGQDKREQPAADELPVLDYEIYHFSLFPFF